LAQMGDSEQRPLMAEAGGLGEGPDDAIQDIVNDSGCELLLESFACLCFEVDSCCGCCDLQVGAKVIAIMGIVQGLTNCMSISTAGFLAAPTLMIGCLSVGFGLYGFWGAQKYDKKKIRVHFYWLLASIMLLSAVSFGRVYTSAEFCSSHNCVVDHMFYPQKPIEGNFDQPRIIATDKAAELLVEDEGSSLSMTDQAGQKTGFSAVGTNFVQKSIDPDAHSGAAAHMQAIPIYREPCYVASGQPSLTVCAQAHKLSAYTTICATVPLNLYFAFIIRSLYLKVKRGDLPEEEPNRPIGRPIQVGHAIPPMTTYEASQLNGSPASGRYHRGKIPDPESAELESAPASDDQSDG